MLLVIDWSVSPVLRFLHAQSLRFKDALNLRQPPSVALTRNVLSLELGAFTFSSVVGEAFSSHRYIQMSIIIQCLLDYWIFTVISVRFVKNLLIFWSMTLFYEVHLSLRLIKGWNSNISVFYLWFDVNWGLVWPREALLMLRISHYRAIISCRELLRMLQDFLDFILSIYWIFMTCLLWFIAFA